MSAKATCNLMYGLKLTLLLLLYAWCKLYKPEKRLREINGENYVYFTKRICIKYYENETRCTLSAAASIKRS